MGPFASSGTGPGPGAGAGRDNKDKDKESRARAKKTPKAKAKQQAAPSPATPMSVPSTPGGAAASRRLSVGGSNPGSRTSDPLVKMEKYEKVACFHRVLENAVSKHDLYQAKRFKEALDKQGNHSLGAQLEARLRVCNAAMMLTPAEVAKLPWEQVEVLWPNPAEPCVLLTFGS